MKSVTTSIEPVGDEWLITATVVERPWFGLGGDRVSVQQYRGKPGDWHWCPSGCRFDIPPLACTCDDFGMTNQSLDAMVTIERWKRDDEKLVASGLGPNGCQKLQAYAKEVCAFVNVGAWPLPASPCSECARVRPCEQTQTTEEQPNDRR